MSQNCTDKETYQSTVVYMYSSTRSDGNVFLMLQPACLKNRIQNCASKKEFKHIMHCKAHRMDIGIMSYFVCLI